MRAPSIDPWRPYDPDRATQQNTKAGHPRAAAQLPRELFRSDLTAILGPLRRFQKGNQPLF